VKYKSDLVVCRRSDGIRVAINQHTIYIFFYAKHNADHLFGWTFIFIRESDKHLIGYSLLVMGGA
jgi:hypothetical protein